MKTLSEMSTGHIIIEAIFLLVVIVAAFYILYSFVYLAIILSKVEDEPDNSEMSSKARYKVAEEIMTEIKNSKK